MNWKFGVVPSTEATLVEEYGIKAFPTIVIEQTVDIDDNSVVEKVQMKYKGAMDYSVIHDFIFRFARKDKPNEEEIQGKLFFFTNISCRVHTKTRRETDSIIFICRTNS